MQKREVYDQERTIPTMMLRFLFDRTLKRDCTSIWKLRSVADGAIVIDQLTHGLLPSNQALNA